MFKLLFRRIKRKINHGPDAESFPHSHGCLVPGNDHLFLASELLDPSSGVPGKEMQEEATGSPCVREKLGNFRRVRAAWGMLVSLPHSGSAEVNSKGSCKGKMRSRNMQLEGRM